MTEPRRPHLTGYDAVVLTIVATGSLILVLATGSDLRRFVNATGVVVFGLLLWRLISTWPRLTVLEHALTMLLAASPLVSALASYNLLRIQGPDLQANPALWAVLLHRVACVILIVFWTRWLGRRHSPFQREPRAIPSGHDDQRADPRADPRRHR